MQLRRPFAMIAATLAATLALAACGSDAGGPAEALEARLAQGTTVGVRIEADPGGLSDEEGAAELQEFLDMQGDGSMLSLSLSPDGDGVGVAIADAVWFRQVTDDIYLRIDWDRVAELSDGEFPPAGTDPQAMADEMAAQAPDLAPVAKALAAGEWIGITGVSEQLEDALGSALEGAPFGATDLATPSTPDQEEMAALAEEYGLDSIGAVIETYVTVEGDNPWDLTLDVAAIEAAMTDISAEAAELGIEEGMGDLESEFADAPDTLGGISVTAEDGVASEIRFDLAEVATAMAADGDGDELDAEDLAAMQDTDAAFVLSLSDLGDNAGAPADATTVAMADLLALFGMN